MDSAGLLGDTSARDYARKLRLFNLCAEPELRAALGSLGLQSGMRVLDAGCGAGTALPWLIERVGQGGQVIGLDLAAPHIAAARAICGPRLALVQADLTHPPFQARQFDAIWSVNTVNHLRDAAGALRQLCELLRTGGTLAVGQSAFLPDMIFAWDAALEDRMHTAIRRYYRERYALTERATTSVRGLLGLLQGMPLRDLRIRTRVIERIAPFTPADVAYLSEVILARDWAERLGPYLDAQSLRMLARMCDPDHEDFALRRPDFHFLQTFTMALGRR